MRAYSIQYVRIVDPDMTARARIREAALTLIAERGLAATSVRDVARAAGVSPGLVQHHFHTKEGLHRHVDEWVVELLRDEFGGVDLNGPPSVVSDRLVDAVVRYGSSHPALPPYVARSLLEGGPLAKRFFDGFLGLSSASVARMEARDAMRPGTDLTWAALNLTLIWLAPLLLQPLVEPHLDQPLLSDAGMRRWRDANAALIAHGLVRPEGGTS